MRHLIWLVLLSFFLVACPSIEDGPLPVPDPPPTHDLVIDYIDVTEIVVYEDGYRCWYTNRVVPFSWQAEGVQAYETLPPATYCACWLRVPPVTFEYTHNGEPTTAIIRHCKIFTVEEDGEEIRIVAR